MVRIIETATLGTHRFDFYDGDADGCVFEAQPTAVNSQDISSPIPLPPPVPAERVDLGETLGEGNFTWEEVSEDN